jgi:hypothetical protein
MKYNTTPYHKTMTIVMLSPYDNIKNSLMNRLIDIPQEQNIAISWKGSRWVHGIPYNIIRINNKLSYFVNMERDNYFIVSQNGTLSVYCDGNIIGKLSNTFIELSDDDDEMRIGTVWKFTQI